MLDSYLTSHIVETLIANLQKHSGNSSVYKAKNWHPIKRLMVLILFLFMARATLIPNAIAAVALFQVTE